ncbi:Chemotaxis protein CheY [compost metagenome]
MPGMDGIEALKAMRALDPAARFIMCSAMGQQTLVMEAVRSGASDFIVKPFKADRVLEAVRRAVEPAAH